MSKKDAFWFSHDSNAKDDPKITLLIDQLALEGYGIFWVLIETLRDQPEYKYPIILIPSIARKYNTTTEKVKSVVFNYGLFSIENNEFFFSSSLCDRMLRYDDNKEKRRVAGLKSGEVRREKVLQKNEHMFNTCSTHVEQKTNIEEYSIVEDSIGDNRIEENRKKNINNSILNLIPENSQNEFQAAPEPQLNLIESKPEPKPKKEKPQKVFSEEIKKLTGDLAKFFPENVTQNLTIPEKLKWCETVEQLIKIDKYTPAEIKEITIWARGDSFWCKNFLSIRKLRQKNTTGTPYMVYFMEVLEAKKKVAENAQNNTFQKTQFLTADEKREIKLEKFEKACVNVMHELLNEKPNQYNDPSLPY